MHRAGQQIEERLHLLPVKRQDVLPRVRDRRNRHLRCDEWIAVPVAADPRSKAEHRRHLRRRERAPILRGKGRRNSAYSAGTVAKIEAW